LKKIDITGQRFGRLTVIRQQGSNARRESLWLCRCDCGTEWVAIGANIRYGMTRGCGCERLGKRRENSMVLRRDAAGRLPRKYLGKGEAAFNFICNGLKTNARKRGLVLQLSKEQLRRLFLGRCYYCGCPPRQGDTRAARRQNGIFLYNGIDRLDSSRGYVLDNVVTACGACNRAKLAMSVSEFRDWLTRAYGHFCAKRDERTWGQVWFDDG